MIETLKEIIDPQVWLEHNGINADEIILKENSSDSKIKNLTIMRTPKNCFAFTLDCDIKNHKKNYAQLSSYFNEANKIGINKSCDLVILDFDNAEGIVEVSLIDLKSDKIKKKKCEDQINNSKLFIEYLFKIIQFYYKKEFDIKFRKIIIYTGHSHNKVPVYRGNKKTEKPLKYICLRPNNGKAEIFYKKIIDSSVN